MVRDNRSAQTKKIQTCSLEHGSVKGVAFRKKSCDHGSPLTTCHRSVASGANVGNGFGAGDGGSGGEQLVKLSLGKGIGQDEGPVLHAASAENDAGKDLIHCGCKLPATHVGGGAVDAGNGH
jgi:hypothetical protein